MYKIYLHQYNIREGYWIQIIDIQIIDRKEMIIILMYTYNYRILVSI